MPLLSVIVPVYNEAKTIRQILERIALVPIEKEIIVIDDSSTDETAAILQDILKSRLLGDIKVIYHSSNKGKGASVKEGILQAKGELCVIQDADMEYDPQDYTKLTPYLLDNRADLALGVRFIKGHSGLFMHRLGNRFLTGLINFFFKSHLNDYATCYKMAHRQTFLALKLESLGFNIDVEIVCKALKHNLKIAEVAVSYQPRSYREGKKIRWFDGLRAISGIFKYKFNES